MRVLVVEDEQKVANALREGLEGERYDVVVERTGEGAFFRIKTETFDLILLDLGLPGRDGLQILTALRSNGVKTPVLVLTARDTLQDRVAGLDSGADDYLVKPFAFAELLARIRALLRRGRVAESPRLPSAISTMDLVTRKVTRGGQPVELTVREFELLEYLLRYEGQVVSRETLARDVWKETARTTPLDNVIDVHIARLRRKVDLDRPVQADSHRARRRLHAARGRAVSRWWRSHSVRVQLTLWYVAAMIARARRLRGASSRSSAAAPRSSLNQQLRSDFQWAAAMVEQTAGRRHHLERPKERRSRSRPWLQVWDPRRHSCCSATTSRSSSRRSAWTWRICPTTRSSASPTASVPLRVLSRRRRDCRQTGGHPGRRDRKSRCASRSRNVGADSAARPAAGGRGGRLRRLCAGAAGAGADRADDRARARRSPPSG